MVWTDVIDAPPNTFNGWDNAVKEAGLHTRYTEQLGEIHDSTEQKIPRLERMLAEAQAASDWRVIDNPDGSYTTEDWSEERQEQITNAQRKIKRANAVLKLCLVETKIREQLKDKGKAPVTPSDFKRGRTLPVDKSAIPAIPNDLTREVLG